MATNIIDERLIGALHLRALTRQGLAHDPLSEHRAVQAGTLDALMAGGYDGDASLAEVLRLGDTGIGTIQHLGGEMVILDGTPWLIDADGLVTKIPETTKTPFAVVCQFSAAVSVDLDAGLDFGALLSALDQLAPASAPILAVRAHGTFTDLVLRSVRRQHHPYPPLSEVVQSQTSFEIHRSVGTLVGFRFPDAAAGLEVPGYHLHFLADDRGSGGHVMDLRAERVVVEIDHCEEIHVELPPGVALGTLSGADTEAIAAVEGRGGMASS